MIFTLIKKVYVHFKNDSLYRNSLYLMISNFAMAVLGFVFWIVNARVYPAREIGLATALLSITTLISTFSMVGLNSGLLRYLPNSNKKNEIINTTFSVSILVSFVLSVVFILAIPIFSPRLMIVKTNNIHAALFVMFAIFTTLNLLVDNIFISYRASGNVLIKSVIFSLMKLVLPIALVTLGAFGIFYAVSIALSIGFVIAIFLLIYKFHYIFKPQLNKKVLLQMASFSLGNYLINIIGSLPLLLMPTIITNSLGPKYTAYYYMPSMIANLLYIVPITVCQSLFTEGIYDKEKLNHLLKKASLLIFLIVIPAIICIVFFGRYILLAFGKEYSADGYQFLQLVIVSGIFVSCNTVLGTLLKIKDKINIIIFISAIGSATTILFSLGFVQYGLTVLGTIFLVGSLLQTLLFAFFLLRKNYLV